MLDSALKEQLKSVFSSLSSKYTLLVELHPSHPKGDEMVELLGEVAESSKNIELKIADGEALKLTLVKDNVVSGISFRAVPNGHEFTSLLLAILNLDGKGKNLPDEFTQQRIRSIAGEVNLTTYMSLTCTNCPDVVQSLNIMAALNHRIKSVAVDGALYRAEVDGLGVQSVPTVYANGELLHVVRGGIADLLSKLESKYGVDSAEQKNVTRTYDVAIAGGGPAGITAALYLARKGLMVAVVAERIGGQVNETSAIENIPSIPLTTGATLAADLKRHIEEYSNIELLENRTIESFESEAMIKRLRIAGGESIEAEQLIIATGAEWRRLGIAGESEYIGKGVAFCPHCDGPLFKGKKVAVIGGGNSGVEAAIDLSGICEKVYLYEFMDQLKADNVLQEKLRSLPNIDVFASYQTLQIVGDGSKVIALEVKNRTTDEVRLTEVDGVFIQIGLSANSSLFNDAVNINRAGEIEVDRNGRTSQSGIYAAGDVTNSSYKQIIISMGEGAKAALAAFDDRIRTSV